MKYHSTLIFQLNALTSQLFGSCFFDLVQNLIACETGSKGGTSAEGHPPISIDSTILSTFNSTELSTQTQLSNVETVAYTGFLV